MPSVLRIPEQELSVVRPNYQMIKSTLELDSQLASYKEILLPCWEIALGRLDMSIYPIPSSGSSKKLKVRPQTPKRKHSAVSNQQLARTLAEA